MNFLEYTKKSLTVGDYIKLERHGKFNPKTEFADSDFSDAETLNRRLKICDSEINDSDWQLIKSNRVHNICNSSYITYYQLELLHCKN